MSQITYVRGDATAPSVKGVKVIVHVCNGIGGWGKGFVPALSRRRPEPEKAYRARHRERATNDFGLAAVQLVQVEPDVWVASMAGRRGVRTGSKGVPVRYEAMDAALDRPASEAAARGACVHLPRTGCGLAGGKWSLVEPLVLGRLVERGIAVTFHDHAEGAK
ncbi:Appr-1-p processing protein [Streptomyces bobili]|uniref:Appr-1-p processing protein n=1 Tax=Streptomyces bobili TaxID=67280 RepID=UPI00339E061D